MFSPPTRETRRHPVQLAKPEGGGTLFLSPLHGEADRVEERDDAVYQDVFEELVERAIRAHQRWSARRGRVVLEPVTGRCDGMNIFLREASGWIFRYQLSKGGRYIKRIPA